jgi:hypothetical protein
MTESTGNESVAVPACWDPKNRKAIWKPETIVPGILTATRTTATFAYLPQAILFSERVSALEVTWSNRLVGAVFKNRDGETIHRIYLAPPVKGTPTLSEVEVGALADIIGTTAKVADSISWGGSLLSSAGTFADLLSLASRTVVFARGYKNIAQIKRLWAVG